MKIANEISYSCHISTIRIAKMRRNMRQKKVGPNYNQ